VIFLQASRDPAIIPALWNRSKKEETHQPKVHFHVQRTRLSPSSSSSFSKYERATPTGSSVIPLCATREFYRKSNYANPRRRLISTNGTSTVFHKTEKFKAHPSVDFKNDIRCRCIESCLNGPASGQVAKHVRAEITLGPGKKRRKEMERGGKAIPRPIDYVHRVLRHDNLLKFSARQRRFDRSNYLAPRRDYLNVAGKRITLLSNL